MNNYDLSLSYSARKMYLTCPKQYYFRYIQKEKGISDPRDTLFGSIIGKIFEWFYERKLYASTNPEQELLRLIPAATDEVFIREKYLDGADFGYEQTLSQNLKEYVRSGVGVIRNNKLVKITNKAEKELTIIHKFKSGLTLSLVGFADFVLSDDPKNIWIMDGKASKYREKYVDPQQLIWYALTHYLKYQVAPSRLGFIFWMFPDNPLTWVSYASDDMRLCASETEKTALKILNKEFSARASGDCVRCNFKHMCDEGQQHIADRKSLTISRVDNSLFDIETLT